jgi:hypothetical protein
MNKFKVSGIILRKKSLPVLLLEKIKARKRTLPIHKVIEIRRNKPVKLCTGHKLKVTRVFFKRATNATYCNEFVTCKECKKKLKNNKSRLI